MNTRTSLLPHQLPAVDKLAPLRIGALFMDMGTGKSRTAIELVKRRERRIWNVAWFCLVSCKQTIAAEIRKHTDSGEEDIHVWNGATNRKNVPDVFWQIIGIESMSASRRVILAAHAVISEFTMMIVDESSYIKGHRSARSNWITRLSARARYRLILTGTPISQGVVDLYSQMRFLHPRILGYSSFYSFAHNHLEYSDKYPGMIVRAHNTEWLAAKIQPYVYQVTKEECLDLPEKLFETRYFSMTAKQRAYYELAKEELLLSLDPDDFDSIAIFRLFNVLQQIVSGFWNRKIQGKPDQFIEMEHRRLDVLEDLIERIPDGEKIIIWAKFTHDIHQIAAALRDRHGAGSVALFHGRIPESHRRNEIEKFLETARFFVATQSCGGHGLNELIGSAYVLYYNNNFKYSERLQSEDRNHRIGQIRQVTYGDIVCDGSIDNRIMSALWNKGNVVDEFKREVDKVKGKRAKIEDLIRSL